MYSDNDFDFNNFIMKFSCIENDASFTMLHYACMTGNIEAVRHLLSITDDSMIYRKDSGGMTPIDWARTNGYKNIVYLMQDYQASQQQYSTTTTTTTAATTQGDKRGINSVFDDERNHMDEWSKLAYLQEQRSSFKNNSFNVDDFVAAFSTTGRSDAYTMLHYACETGNEKAVNYLLPHLDNSQLEAEDDLGFTPLFYAKMRDDILIFNAINNRIHNAHTKISPLSSRATSDLPHVILNNDYSSANANHLNNPVAQDLTSHLLASGTNQATADNILANVLQYTDYPTSSTTYTTRYDDNNNNNNAAAYSSATTQTSAPYTTPSNPRNDLDFSNVPKDFNPFTLKKRKPKNSKPEATTTTPQDNAVNTDESIITSSLQNMTVSSPKLQDRSEEQNRQQ